LSAKYQNEINISIVFNYLREKGPISRSKMSRALGLSAPAVSRAINSLEKDGYILEVVNKNKCWKKANIVKNQ
jgi:uncharacterized membrane protein